MKDEAKKNGSDIEGRVAKLETKTSAMGRILDRICQRAEQHWGVDLNADGKIGAGKVALMLVVLAVSFGIGLGIAHATSTVWDITSTAKGTCKVTSNDAGTATLTVDTLSCTTFSPAITAISNATAKVYARTFVTTATGTNTMNQLTASKPVFTDANKALTSSGTVPLNQGGTGTTSYYAVVSKDATTARMIQFGCITNSAGGGCTQTFSVAFSAAPYVLVSYAESPAGTNAVYASTTTASSVVIGGKASKKINWVAYGTRP
jgi:hypothetical protein